MDITELPKELKSNNSYIYLLNIIIAHFSKFRISILMGNKEDKTIYNSLKTALKCNCFPNEIGMIIAINLNFLDNYLNEKNYIYSWVTI